ncbi:MAG: serpin family protein [Planctomycetes bacterium]|nr:serpin family protein [Planctomycetota bacterium]MBI3845658.1 serpin family protein [Planctomycetota bacterium]
MNGPEMALLSLLAAATTSARGEETFARASNQFGWSLFRKLTADGAATNVVVSPISVSLALDMALNGARATTHDEMRRTLQLGDLSDDAVNAACESALATLASADPAVVHKIANSIWLRRGFNAKPEFVATNAKHFHAEVRSLDFAAPDAASTINGWVGRATEGKIPAIVPDRIPADVVAYLIDAIYFKGAWKIAFDPKLTKDDSFVRADDTKVPCKLMHRSGSLRCLETPVLQAVELPYGNGAFRATILLPAAGSSIDALLASLDGGLPTGLQDRDGEIFLPRFVTRTESTLNGPLAALGMPTAFTASADFGGIAPKLFISEVKHKTFVEVNEEGTEAAAATSVEVSRTSAQVSPRFVMRVDRPFVFVIHESKSGVVLFLGKIADPSAA